MKELVSTVISYTALERDDSGIVTKKTPMTILLTSIEDVKITESAEITSHPLVTHVEAADHMIQKPDSLTLDGDYSMNGSDSVLINGLKPTLKQFQETFREIKQQAYLCNIAKVTMSTNDVRFLQRQNMALTSISWTEGINSVNFSFSFDQAMLSEIQEYDVDLEDENLPAVTSPSSMSFIETMLDWDEIYETVAEICRKEGLTTKEFWTMLSSMGKAQLAALAIGAPAALVIGLAICASIPVGGWIVGAAILAIASTVVAIAGIYTAIKKANAQKKFRLAQFQAFKDDVKNKNEIERFAKFTGEICLQLKQLDAALSLYQIPSNEPQECMLTIDDEYYVFTFTKNNTIAGSNNECVPWNVTVTNPQDDSAYVSNKSLACAKRGYNECYASDCLFRAAGTGSFVYMMYIRNEDYEEYDLRNYYMLVSSIDPQEINKAIEDIIYNAILL